MYQEETSLLIVLQLVKYSLILSNPDNRQKALKQYFKTLHNSIKYCQQGAFLVQLISILNIDLIYTSKEDEEVPTTSTLGKNTVKAGGKRKRK